MTVEASPPYVEVPALRVVGENGVEYAYRDLGRSDVDAGSHDGTLRTLQLRARGALKRRGSLSHFWHPLTSMPNPFICSRVPMNAPANKIWRARQWPGFRSGRCAIMLTSRAECRLIF